MLSSTRLLSLALLLLGALNAAAAPTGTPPNVPTNVPTNVPANVPATVIPPPAATKTKAKAKGKAKATGAPAPIAGGSGSNQPICGLAGSNQPLRLPAPPKGPVPLAAQPTCAKCIIAGGHWDKCTFTCARVGAIGPNKVTTAAGCAQMLQMQTLFPAVGKASAGLIPQTLSDKFEDMRGHIFRGEGIDPDSGRHIRSSFLAKHPNLTPTVQDATTKIELFSFVGADNTNKIKTVWDDRANAYTALDVRNMCVTAAQILSKAGQTGTQKGAVVVSPFGTNTCITFAHQGSKGTCFPLGVNTTSPLGTICTRQ